MITTPRSMYAVTYDLTVTQLIVADSEATAEEYLINQTPDGLLATLTAKNIREGRYKLTDYRTTKLQEED